MIFFLYYVFSSSDRYTSVETHTILYSTIIFFSMFFRPPIHIIWKAYYYTAPHPEHLFHGRTAMHEHGIALEISLLPT